MDFCIVCFYVETTNSRIVETDKRRKKRRKFFWVFGFLCVCFGLSHTATGKQASEVPPPNLSLAVKFHNTQRYEMLLDELTTRNILFRSHYRAEVQFSKFPNFVQIFSQIVDRSNTLLPSHGLFSQIPPSDFPHCTALVSFLSYVPPANKLVSTGLTA